jgi:hypothetical protein
VVAASYLVFSVWALACSAEHGVAPATGAHHAGTHQPSGVPHQSHPASLCLLAQAGVFSDIVVGSIPIVDVAVGSSALAVSVVLWIVFVSSGGASRAPPRSLSRR